MGGREGGDPAEPGFEPGSSDCTDDKIGFGTLMFWLTLVVFCFLLMFTNIHTNIHSKCFCCLNHRRICGHGHYIFASFMSHKLLSKRETTWTL